MAISVTHGGDPIPKSPFHITVAPPLDIGKVKVEGLDSRTSQMLKNKSSDLLQRKFLTLFILKVFF